MKVFINRDDNTIAYSHDSLNKKHWMAIPDNVEIIYLDERGIVFFGCGGKDLKSLVSNKGFKILWERNK